jgi:hypothetical protein
MVQIKDSIRVNLCSSVVLVYFSPPYPALANASHKPSHPSPQLGEGKKELFTHAHRKILIDNLLFA